MRALREGWIAGAGMDIFDEEPLPAARSLWDLSNGVVLPPQGADTSRSMERATAVVWENLRCYAAGLPLVNVVDPARGY